MYHNPVLLKESIDGLNIKPNGIYVDVTFGGGGHSKEIIKKLTTGKLFAFDQDEDACENAIDNENFTFINQNFKYINNYLKFYRVEKIDGLIADLGVSSYQFDTPERGFSTRFNSTLDMRMDKSLIKTAESIVNEYTFEQLAFVFRNYGEINNAGKIANDIILYRKNNKISNTDDLKKALERNTNKNNENKFFAQIFQALRIEVNEELDALKELLLSTEKTINKGGRIVFISYHSLEDRLVKNYMKSGNFECKLEKDFYGNILTPFNQIHKKVIIPSDEEIEINSRARSAKLRIAEKN